MAINVKGNIGKTIEVEHLLTQYSLFGNGFMPVGDVRNVPTLPTGCYSIVSTMQGPYFSPMYITTDELIHFPDTKLDEVAGEIERFWGLKDKFDKYGFIFK